MSCLPVQFSGGVVGAGQWGPALAAPFAVDSRAAARHHAVMGQADQSDADDVRACLGGDGDAYERLVRRHQQTVAIRMRHFTRDAGRLEELVQDVFVEAYFSLCGYRGDAPLTHWLARIATRVGYRLWKAETQRRQASAATLPLADWDGPAGEPRGPHEAAELLHRLMGQLPPRDRLVLTLMHLEGRSVAETAEMIGWSRTMVKVQAHRARKKLKAVLVAAGLGGPNAGQE
jgi:RNA polymerase sigma-70 factor (ECF subfamily)